ncbi:hypothetical protein [Nonomuraea sp. SYSU D8015]|uniref:hypothetical protein n=1 Tax=Nonomuraea sp. SYSU D8015 TaxID=2593644 RepID=UPI001661388C|nr:hypothetical protein [Nonomuraea sp. SYSU D8015]
MTLRDQDLIEICVKKRTRLRVSDARCDDEDDGYAWYYLLLSRQIPGVGKKAMNGSFRASDYSTTYRARPGGGKGRKVAFDPDDEDVDSTVTDDTDTDSTFDDTDFDSDPDFHHRKTPGRTRAGRR